jgi:SAM-dependent methyltransferase
MTNPHAVNLAELLWAEPGPKAWVAARCTVCDHAGPHAPMLSVPSLAPPHPLLTLLHCDRCGSGFYDPPGIADFTDLNRDRDDFWRFYVEVGGGVWETIWPLLSDAAEGTRTLLDVGCGFGFAVDFWKRTMGAEAVGVELADYGGVGARMLDITVYREMVQDCAALAGRRFDIVYASEVIEHVPDPRAFVALLARFLADDGVLVLTTPAVEFVKRSNFSPTLLAALAPGFHGFLLSAQAFGDCARAVGFEHVDVRTFGERQMLWASRVPRRLDFGPQRSRPLYFEYLEDCLKRHEPSTPLWQGFAYRAIRDLVGASRFAEARAKADVLLNALIEIYGPAIVDPDAMLVRLHEAWTLAEFSAHAPFFLPNIYFALGAIAEHLDRDVISARRWYRGAAAIAHDCARLGAIFFLEAAHLIWPARVAEAALALSEGEIATAAATFARLARDGRRCEGTDGYAIASPEYIEMVIPRACEGFVLANAWEAASDIFEGYCDYLAQSFPGRDYRILETVERALADDAAGGAMDPVFAFFFQALLDVSPGVAEPNVERLHALTRLATALHAHPKHGALVARYDDIGRRYFPAVPSKALFDFSYSIASPIGRKA